MKLPLLNPRKCGACDVCCKVMEVPELSKPAHVPCKDKLSSGGCGRYNTRPAACRDWRCMWVGDEVGTLDDRPDKIGGFFWIQGGTDFGSIVVLEANEAGSLTPRALAMADTIALTRLVYIRDTDKQRRMIGPPAMMRQVVSEFEVRDIDYRASENVD